MQFLDCIRPRKNEIIALVGAGGKTSVLFAMGKEVAQSGGKVILTTTTKIYEPNETDMKVVVADEPGLLVSQINMAFDHHNIVVVGKSRLPTAQLNFPPKLLGLDFALFDILCQTKADMIIVEADGAGKKPLKAPAPHEPVIPSSATIVIPVVGIDCIHKPLASDHVHRADLVARIAGVSLGQAITPDVVTAVFTSDLGYLKCVPPQAKWIPFINKVETSGQLTLAREIAKKIRAKTSATVLIGAAQEEEPVREVIGL